MREPSIYAYEGKKAFLIRKTNGKRQIYFRGLLNKENKRRLITPTEIKKRNKKKRSNQREALRFHDQRATADEGKRWREDRAYMMQPNGRGLSCF